MGQPTVSVIGKAPGGGSQPTRALGGIWPCAWCQLLPAQVASWLSAAALAFQVAAFPRREAGGRLRPAELRGFRPSLPLWPSSRGTRGVAAGCKRRRSREATGGGARMKQWRSGDPPLPVTVGVRAPGGAHPRGRRGPVAAVLPGWRGPPQPRVFITPCPGPWGATLSADNRVRHLLEGLGNLQQFKKS